MIKGLFAKPRSLTDFTAKTEFISKFEFL